MREKSKLTGTLVTAIILLGFSLVTGCDLSGELTEEDFKFDGPLGSEGTTIEKLEPNIFKVTLGNAPNQPEWNNKLNFQITGNAKGNDLTLYVEGPPRYAMNEYFYSWSYDMENWNPVHWKSGHRISPDRDTLVFPVFEQDQVYVGHQVPISYEQVEEFIASIEPLESVDVDTLGESLGGRNLYRLTITDPASNVPDQDRWVHYFTNPHPGEHNSQWRMIGKIEWLLSEQGRDMRQRSICHFVLMMSPDGPSNGWYRVNAQGVDMNRSYFPEGADKEEQAHESYIFQRDLELIMESESPVNTLWGHHTWGGIVEPLLYYAEDERVGHWNQWRDIMLDLDTENLIKPLDTRGGTPSYGAVSWELGPHTQFGINAILCEGAGAIYTKEENKESGRILIESLGRYYEGTKAD
ncbi:MAG: M14 family zinc carboxypeptidase [Bacteroidales bacterium]